MKKEDKQEAIAAVRSLADELSTAGARAEHLRDTCERVDVLFGSKGSLVRWHNELPKSPLKSAIRKAISHLSTVRACVMFEHRQTGLKDALSAAAEQLPKLCDQMERLASTKPKPRKQIPLSENGTSLRQHQKTLAEQLNESADLWFAWADFALIAEWADVDTDKNATNLIASFNRSAKGRKSRWRIRQRKKGTKIGFEAYETEEQASV